MSHVIIIGGGAAGMMAAIAAAGAGHKVCIYEKNEKLGKKIYITGKGRCNVTNACDTEELFQNVVHNAKFLYSSFYAFTNTDIMDLIEKHGCPLKTERGNRVFPISDKSSDVIHALTAALRKLGVEVELLANGKVAILVKNTGKPIDPEKIKDVLVQKTDVSSNGIGLQYVARMLENRFGDNFELKAERTEDGMNVVEICIPFDPVEVVLGESSIKIGEVSRK